MISAKRLAYFMSDDCDAAEIVDSCHDILQTLSAALKVVEAAKSALFEYEEDKSFQHVRNAMTRLNGALAPFAEEKEKE